MAATVFPNIGVFGSGFISVSSNRNLEKCRDEINERLSNKKWCFGVFPVIVDKNKLIFDRIYGYKIYEKYKNKGIIKEGFDADLTIIDLNLEKEVKNNELLTKCKWSPFDGWKLKGWPIITIINGNIIFENGKINNIAANEVSYNE